MGTTLTGMWRPSASGPAIIFQVGDSRLYRYRAGELTQLTHDQSLYQQAIDNGITDNLPKRSLLLQAIGPAVDIKPDVKSHAIETGDLYMLCSDGLHNSVAHADIQDVLSTAAADGLESACRRLIALAKADGAPDNVTVILANLDAIC
jgi:protein phosphatase